MQIRNLLITAAMGTLVATAALAADSAMPAQPSPNNAAVKSPDTNISSAPVKGANSFTEGQARSHIMAKGYSHVTGLKKDANGVWRGSARMQGKTVPVSMDFEGNVNPI